MIPRASSAGRGRSLLVFALLPGTFAIALPAAWIAWNDGGIEHPIGLVPLLGGLVALVRCALDFHVRGRGTIAPWQPPERLVVVGLYRRSRNPMYLAVLAIVIGWATAFASTALALYALGLWAAFHATVVTSEEPWLARTFGDEWRRYAERVPRWLW